MKKRVQNVEKFSGKEKSLNNYIKIFCLRGVIDTDESDSAISMTQRTFAQANLSSKSKPSAKILQHKNKGPRWVTIMKKQGVTHLVALSVCLCVFQILSALRMKRCYLQNCYII